MPRAQKEWRYLYGRRWREARANYLTQYPLCRYCEQGGKLTPAAELDHIIPHKGNPELFWNVDNWQGLCAEHHRSTKQKEEAIGKQIGCDVDGNPNEPGSHWTGGG